MGHCLPLYFSALHSSYTHTFLLTGKCTFSDSHTSVYASTAKISSLTFTFITLHTSIPLWQHVPYNEPFFDMVQLKTNVNGKLLAHFCVFLFVKTQHAVLGFSLFNTPVPRVSRPNYVTVSDLSDMRDNENATYSVWSNFPSSFQFKHYFARVQTKTLLRKGRFSEEERTEVFNYLHVIISICTVLNLCSKVGNRC